jgi:uncharacterized membrane protein YGL010W
MKTIDQWLGEYGESHKNPTNKLIHWICVPSIVFSILLMLLAIPVPSFFNQFSLDWSKIIIILAIAYYMFLSTSLALGMTFVFWLMTLLGDFIAETSAYPVWGIGVVLFILAWAGQFYGHKIEGKKPSFLKDIQFLLIGPVWLLSFIYKRLNIPQ